jgi:acetyl esterase/lipase
MRVALCSICVLLFAPCSLFSQDLPKSVVEADRSKVVIINDVVCGKMGDEDCKLDLALPAKTDGSAPCIVVIHGGAWRAGNKGQHATHIKRFAELGYVSASLQYRFCPKHPFPAQIEDVKCAVRFLRGNADKLGMDPKRVGAMGVSAGAHLAMLLNTVDEKSDLEGSGGHADQSSKVQCAVSIVGPTALDAEDIPDISKGLLRDFIGGTPQEKPELTKKASPIAHLSKDDGPILMIHGTQDELVPQTQVYKMVDAMGEVGLRGRAEILPGLKHGLSKLEIDRALRETELFFAEYLKP